MNPSTVATIIIGAGAALIGGMAALIKAMVIGKLDGIAATLEDVRSELHDIDLRVTRLEAEHSISCHRRRGDE